MKKLFFYVLLLIYGNPALAQLYINEFMASNSRTVTDEHLEYDDWLELYNSHEIAINLSGYYLTDDFDEPTKWAFPEITIPAKTFLIVWTDDSPEQGNFHANFKLKAAGDEIGLYYGSAFIDSIRFDAQLPDISYGRSPDGTDKLYFFSNPTPNAPNDTSKFLIAEAPAFSYSNGFYTTPITLELRTKMEGADIYYTTDCTEPTPASRRYNSPIRLETTTVIRARIFKNGFRPGQIISRTYFINEQRHLPVLALVTDPDNLWDPDSGIYVSGKDPENPNFKQGWERPVSLEFFDKSFKPAFAVDAGLQIHGGHSIWFQKKSFQICFRKEYGMSWLNYPLFRTKNINQFKRLVVASGSNDSPTDKRADTQKVWSMIRDILMHDLSANMGGLVAAKEPAFLYLNGKPWGIYYLSERIDEYYLDTNYGVAEADLIEFNDYAKRGTEERWNELIAFLTNNDLQSDENYNIAAQLIDIPSFIDYNIVEIFGSNKDWPHNNTLCYRPHGENQVWRWIMWDADVTLGSPPSADYTYNALNWATRHEPSTLVLRSLLRNKTFQIDFTNRFADLLNTLLTTDQILAKIDSLTELIRMEIPTETGLWGSHIREWESHIADIKNYVQYRPAEVRKHVQSILKCNGTFKLTIEAPLGGEGFVQINTILPKTYPWAGFYYNEVPLRICAIPAPGYQFLRWEGDVTSLDDSITISRYKETKLRPVFQKLTMPPQVSNLKVDSIRSTSAVILFQTDQPAIGQIHYSPDDKFNLVSSQEQNFMREHQIKLRELNPGILYNFKIHVRNNDGDIDSSSTGLFITLDSTFLSLKIKAISTEKIMPVSTRILWETERPATSQVFWGETENLDFFTEIDTTAVIHHAVVLKGLKPQTKYYFKVKSADRYENQVLSELQQFMTGDTTQLRISRIAADEIGHNNIKILWETNKSSTAQIKFGTNPDSLDKVKNDSSWQLKHEMNLNNLTENFNYYFQIKVFDQDQESISSPTFNFNTLNNLGKNQLDMVYEIELMPERSTGFYEAPGWNFGSNGTTGMKMNVQKSGNYKITARVKGIHHENVAPEMAIWLDSLTIIQKSITFSNFDTLSTITAIDSGNHFIQIRIKNDAPDTMQHATLIGDWLKFSFLPETGIGLENKLGENRIELTNYIRNYPNPVNNSTIISYRIVKASPVKIKIYNLAGQEVLTLVDAPHDAGNYKLTWNGENLYGSPVASGLYLLKLETPSEFLVSRIVLLK